MYMCVRNKVIKQTFCHNLSTWKKTKKTEQKGDSKDGNGKRGWNEGLFPEAGRQIDQEPGWTMAEDSLKSSILFRLLALPEIAK